MKKIRFSFITGVLLLSLVTMVATGCSTAKQATPTPANPNIILATTTSTQDSGLLDVLIPIFEQKTGYMVKTVAVGTGDALKRGEKGEVDVLLVHAPASEQPLVDNQTAINYQLVMHNDFILVGPASDPAKAKGIGINNALKAIADTKSVFISRGDDSGTHKKELAIWKTAAITPSGTWYQESGTGMGQTLTIASEKEGYTLSDRATYLATKDTLKLNIIIEGGKNLLNIYHVMQVNPEKFPNLTINSDGAKAFVEFLMDPETQKTINDFGKDKYGESLFFADAGKKMEDLK